MHAFRPARRSRLSAFTLLEIFVVLGIVALMLALIIPYILRLREGGHTGECVRNLQLIGKAIQDYAKDHDGQLPGPLATDQYPTGTAGNPARDGQLLKYIATYLEQPSGGPLNGANADTIFTFPAWERNTDRTSDSPVFLLNNEFLNPLTQPAWGSATHAPVKLAQLKDWKRIVAGKELPIDPSRVWALTEADQEIARILKLRDAWVPRLPPTMQHGRQRHALYFDWHVETLAL